MTSRRGGVRVAVALGSNLGDRAGHLAWAVAALRTRIDGLRVSAIVETAPVDVPDVQPDYLNAVAVGHTELAPEPLLVWLLELERSRGRVRIGPRSARTLDLDLVLYGNHVVSQPGLTVPHPRYRDRDFVLGPLAEVAPRWRDPSTGETMARMWRTRRLPRGG